MKVVILAGGMGTRMSELTKTIPKPMVKVKKKPILIHIMEHYSNMGFNEFFIALGYKGHVIRKFFKGKNFNWKVHLIDTGKNTMTGGRVKRLKKYLKNERFFLTYGDGISDVNIKKLLKFHKKHKKSVTLTAVRPPARFGSIKLNHNKVKIFKEKSKLDEGWINGGFFVFEPDIFKYIRNDQTYLEREPLEIFSKKSQLMAFKHHGFWQCMDTKRDKQLIEKILDK
ncbi:sugar phosphate nucleotidyltransferase [Candidatus Pelagibacter sp.]|nr:sugar phosphate nucleotidyltransferase [Candidatus Pelagibacter sp.]